MPGTLYVVATPIGNLEDMSPRAVRTLREAALIAAEDTRTTRKLLSHFEIRTPLTSYHAHSRPEKTAAILARLEAGEDVALVSDAGTPGISDPGGLLVRAAAEAGCAVTPVPGPSAAAAALSAGGLDPGRFVFEGFLPRKAGERRRVLETLRPLPHTLVFYEAPGRVAETLAALREALGDRPAVVARELTKKFEEFARGPLSALEARYRAAPPRGECVLLVGGMAAGAAGETERAPAAVEERLEELLRGGMSVRDAAKTAAAELGRPRNEVYALAREAAARLEGRAAASEG
jgi:16S rRNA (cytidine1402-2'-O)-methyltransferase